VKGERGVTERGYPDGNYQSKRHTRPKRQKGGGDEIVSGDACNRSSRKKSSQTDAKKPKSGRQDTIKQRSKSYP